MAEKTGIEWCDLFIYVPMALAAHRHHLKPVLAVVAFVVVVLLRLFSAETKRHGNWRQFPVPNSLVHHNPSVQTVGLWWKAGVNRIFMLPATRQACRVDAAMPIDVSSKAIQFLPGAASEAPFHASFDGGKILIERHTKALCSYLHDSKLATHVHSIIPINTGVFNG